MNSNKIVSTNNFSTIIESCEEAKSQSKMIAIIGYPGAGKTTGLMYFYKNYPNTTYVKVLPSMKPKIFYSKILENMGVPDQQNGLTLHYLIKKIAFMLNQSNEKNLLIIDEAGKFTPRMLEYIHELRDLTSDSTGIILAGPDYFQINLKKWVNSNKDGMPEIFRRINTWQPLTRMNKEEVIAMCEINGIKNKNTHNDLFKLCTNFGELHNQIMDLKYLENYNKDE